MSTDQSSTGTNGATSASAGDGGSSVDDRRNGLDGGGAQGAVGWQQRLQNSRFGTIGVLALTAVLVMGGAYLVQRPSDDEAGVTSVSVTGKQLGPPPAVGAPAQNFTARTIDGKPVQLSDYKGRPVWLLFGATWCASCRAEVADVEAAYKQAKASGVEVISLYLSEDASTVQNYTQSTGLTYLHVPDPQTDVASAYRVMGIPAHYFIDKQGNINSIQIGTLDRSTMDSALAGISG